MNIRFFLILIASLPSLLWAVELEQSVAAPAEYIQTLQTAKTAYQQALVNKSAWRDTHKLIKGAEQASQQGNYRKAQQLASQAKQQALNAIAQSQEQAGTGNPDYLY